MAVPRRRDAVRFAAASINPALRFDYSVLLRYLAEPDLPWVAVYVKLTVPINPSLSKSRITGKLVTVIPGLGMLEFNIL